MPGDAWSKQPFKALYTAFFVLKLIILIPLLFLRYSVRSARPDPEWSLRVSVTGGIVREVFRYWTQTRATMMDSVEASHRKAIGQFALAEVADASMYTGLLTPGTTKPAPVGGLWFPGPPTQQTDLRHEKVVLHFPGGAFVLAWGTAESGKDVASIMAQHLKATRTFYAQYRVSADDSTRFPAALQDLVTFYHYVLSLGIDPKNIILSGDSAAGNLVVGLLRYLEDLRHVRGSPQLPLPGGAMIWSPWVDISTEAGQDYIKSRNSEMDFLVPSLLQWGVDAYFPKGSRTSDVMPFISPLHHPFKTSVPLFVNAGRNEAFFDSAKAFATEMELDSNRVRFHASDLAPHNLVQSYKGLAMEHQMEVAIRDARDFFAQAE
ncbi:alpha/beta-hydrolase [Hypoxylon rubiginosum]|uniref:Alpha/beta-hydrolase n=1 Tax=Hypoxylon rubiginosum TaxID=110542 RepID=A0ACC0DI99_9PEZI|nr:alpha/beta-hydrolase [Hypoxylon rubiginosum]